MSPRPRPVPADTGARPDRPPTETESKLREIFGRRLETGRVGAHDDFFALGGTSLQAVAIMAAIEKEFGRRLPVTALIEAPTAAALAALLDAGGGSGMSPLLLRFQAGDARLPPLFLVHGLLGHIFLPPHFLAGVDPQRPVYGIQASGLAGDDPPSGSIAAAARAYLAAIESLTRDGAFHLGGFCYGNLIVLEMSALRRGTFPGASHPILIDPPIHPRGHAVRERRFGGIRLGWRRLLGPNLREPSLQPRLKGVNTARRHWRPDSVDAAVSAHVLEVSAGMSHLLVHHTVGPDELSPVLLCSRERAEKITKPDSFWIRRYGDRLRVRVVAETHKSIFTEELSRVFRGVDDLIVERETQEHDRSRTRRRRVR